MFFILVSNWLKFPQLRKKLLPFRIRMIRLLRWVLRNKNHWCKTRLLVLIIRLVPQKQVL